MKRILSSLYLLLISISLLANDRFAVADIFTDHMVLQRNANVKVWGEGTDGSLVEVRFERTKPEDGGCKRQMDG